MRFGLLALSIAMLSSGGFATQSALAISNEATATIATSTMVADKETGSRYGSMQFAANRGEALRLAMR